MRLLIHQPHLPVYDYAQSGIYAADISNPRYLLLEYLTRSSSNEFCPPDRQPHRCRSIRCMRTRKCVATAHRPSRRPSCFSRSACSSFSSSRSSSHIAHTVLNTPFIVYSPLSSPPPSASLAFPRTSPLFLFVSSSPPFSLYFPFHTRIAAHNMYHPSPLVLFKFGFPLF